MIIFSIKKKQKHHHVAHLFSRSEHLGVFLCGVYLTIILCQTHLWGAQLKDNSHIVNTLTRTWPSVLEFNCCLSSCTITLCRCYQSCHFTYLSSVASQTGVLSFCIRQENNFLRLVARFVDGAEDGWVRIGKSSSSTLSPTMV